MHRVSRGIALGLRVRAAAASGNPAALHTSFQLNAIEVKMPSLSPTMTEGTIVKWSVAEGDEVSAGDVLCEIQTDKAVVALEADEDGKLAKIVKDKDAGMLKVGQLIAVMAEDGEDLAEAIKEAMANAGDVPATAASQEEGESEAAAPTGGSTAGTEVKMPSLSPTMTEGTVVKWCFKEGEKIGAGDVLCEIQTDKAVVSMEVDDDCVLAKILVQADKPGIQVGSLIALTVEEGEDWTDVAIPAAKAAAADKPAAAKETPAAAAKAAEKTGEHVFQHIPNVGPAASLLMAQYGIRSGDVNSSGPKGIVKSDIISHISQRNLQPIKPESPKAAAAAKRAATAPLRATKPRSGYTDHPLSSIRSVIAQRLTASKQTSPHGHATAASDMAAVIRLRKELASAGVRVSVNDFVVKAAATALQYVPQMNLNVSGEDFEIMRNIDISVAVATDSGLITPIVTDVPNKTLPEISADIKALAAKAREGRLQLHEFQGGTFTISNLGMFGIDEFTAIINPPQVAILAVGSSSEQICPNTGAVKNVMKATLSFDRRFIDEALAADFMSAFQSVIERPEFLNLGMLPIVRKDRTKSADYLSEAI